MSIETVTNDSSTKPISIEHSSLSMTENTTVTDRVEQDDKTSTTNSIPSSDTVTPPMNGIKAGTTTFKQTISKLSSPTTTKVSTVMPTTTTTTWNPTVVPPSIHHHMPATPAVDSFVPFAQHHHWIPLPPPGLSPDAAAAAAAAAFATTTNAVAGVGGGSTMIQDPLAAYHHAASLSPYIDAKSNATRSTNNNNNSSSNNSSSSNNNKQVTWDQRLQDLKAYREVHGHCNVPQRWKEDKGLGVWIKTQRSNYRRLKEGKPTSLCPDRIHALTSLGFEWELGGHYEVIAWEDRLEDLKEFKKVHGHCNVPQRWKENRGLGVWIKTQRSYYRKFKQGMSSSSLTADRVQALSDLGFEWEIGKISEDSTWMQKLEALKKFKQKHGHCNVPQRYKEDRSLGHWIKSQRSYFRLWKEGKPSRMTPSRIHELSLIGFEFEFTKVH